MWAIKEKLQDNQTSPLAGKCCTGFSGFIFKGSLNSWLMLNVN